jgi:hypothetical protein
MERTLKVFCSGSEQDRLSDKIPVIERYTGFFTDSVAAGAGGRAGQALSRGGYHGSIPASRRPAPYR